MLTITTKYKRPNQKTHGHTNVFCNEVNVGYIIPDRSKFRTKNENWHFCPIQGKVKHLAASNRTKLMENIIALLQENQLDFQLIK